MTGKHESPDETRIARPSAQPQPEARDVRGQALIDVTLAARRVGFRFPVHITGKAHGQVVKPGTPVGEGLWHVLERALDTYRDLPPKPSRGDLQFYAPWFNSNQGVVALNLELHRQDGRVLFLVIASGAEDRR